MRFNKKGIILVLQHLQELKQGERIEENQSYLERPLATSSSSIHAPFENPCLLLAEVEIRLKKCGRDGFLCKVYYALEESIETISKDLGLSEKEVERGIITALKYVSLKWPKDQTYKEHRYRKGEHYGTNTRYGHYMK